MIIEKRKTRRRDMHHNARLLIAPKQFLDCKLSNVSEAGALIEVADTGALPDRFLLLLAARGSVQRTCHVVWREPNRVGVEFVRSAVKPARKPAAPAVAVSKPAPEHAEAN